MYITDSTEFKPPFIFHITSEIKVTRGDTSAQGFIGEIIYAPSSPFVFMVSANNVVEFKIMATDIFRFIHNQVCSIWKKQNTEISLSISVTGVAKDDDGKIFPFNF